MLEKIYAVFIFTSNLEWFSACSMCSVVFTLQLKLYKICFEARSVKMATTIQICSFYSLLFGFIYINRTKCESHREEFSEHALKHCRRSGSELVCNIIPHDIPDGVQSVYLIDIYVPGRVLQKGAFSSENWSKVKQLDISSERSWTEKLETVQTFDSFCFDGLDNLEKLHISTSTSIDFRPETLRGLNKLDLLDLSGCRRFSLDNLITALSDSESLPNLKSLNLSQLDSFRNGNKFDYKFFKLISDKKIKQLDISSIQVLFMNITAFQENCGTLEYLNLSKIIVSDYEHDYVPRNCPNLKFIDASYITLPSTVITERGPEIQRVSNISIPLNLNWTPIRIFSNVEYINLSGLTPKQTKFIMDNVTAHIFGMSKFNIKTLVLKDNNLERLDLRIISRKSKLETIDLSRCNIHFIHPGLLSSFNLMTRIDISNNRLNEMAAEDVGLFDDLFRNLSRLTSVNLASNYLTKLPRDIFKFNSLMEIIDVSNNLLTQVSFDVEGLKKLKMLNFARNKIHILDDASIARLNCLLYDNNYTNNSTIKLSLMLNDNPFSCSSCKTLSSVNWLVHSESAIGGFSTMECMDENANKVNITQNVIETVQTICNRPKVIIVSCVSAAIVISLLFTLALAIRYRRRRRRYKLEMEDRVALIRQGADSHQFVVFLSYSSKDDDFVYKYVYDPLNEHLQNVIGEHRDLVCEGDRNFQLGRPIHDQISVLLKKSSVVVVLLTDNYSLSVHCRNEFDQAFMLEKPIVLMIKDQVDTELMTPLIRDLYEKRTRILWLWENGQYILKTSWENVCTSIVELVDSK